MARQPNDAPLTQAPRQGTPHALPPCPSPLPLFRDLTLRSFRTEIMLHSALMNVMVKAARRAGRSLKRDLGEIEQLQVSLKGPANFVTKADKRAEEMLFDDLAKARPGYGFLGEEVRAARRRRQEPHLDRRSARRHHQLPARHSAIRDLDRLKRDDTIIAGAGLQSRQ